MAHSNNKEHDKYESKYILAIFLTIVTILSAIVVSSPTRASILIKFENLELFHRSLAPLLGCTNIYRNNLLRTPSRMAATKHFYHISGLEDLVLERSIPLPTETTSSQPTHKLYGNSSIWRFPPGPYTPKQLVDQLSPLFESLLIQLGHDPPGGESSRKVLIDGLRSCLSLDSRESTLPLSQRANSTGNPARIKIASQARRIGSLLVRYAQEVPQSTSANPQLSIRSSCEGHLWMHDVTGLLIGPRSNSNLMQVYNKWLHQLVLLRNGLLPFKNFDQVELIVKSDSSQGTRALENIRPQFLMQVMNAQIKRTTLLDVAKVLMAPGLPVGGYGFQYARGLVLPTSLLAGTSSILLRYIPAVIDSSQHKELLFDYKDKDYFSVPREEIDTPARTLLGLPSDSIAEYSSTVSSILSSSLAFDSPAGAKPSSAVRLIKLCGTLEDGSQFSVDLGQISRGLNYAYRVSPTDNDGTTSPERITCRWHKASEVLSLPNLVTSTSSTGESGLHTIQAVNPVVRLALLGKLYPENIVLLGEGQSLSRALEVGKGFGLKFVIFGGEVALP